MNGNSNIQFLLKMKDAKSKSVGFQILSEGQFSLCLLENNLDKIDKVNCLDLAFKNCSVQDSNLWYLTPINSRCDYIPKLKIESMDGGGELRPRIVRQKGGRGVYLTTKENMGYNNMTRSQWSVY